MNIIAAVDKSWGIGKDNALLFSIPEDMKFFRKMTVGGIVIMGRKTLESFPGKKPLKNRINIILTKDTSYTVEGAEIFHSIDELGAYLREIDPVNEDKVFVIGGGSIYMQLLPYCSRAYITYMDHAFEADTFFPDLDRSEEWILVSESEEQVYEDIKYTFRVYEKKK